MNKLYWLTLILVMSLTLWGTLVVLLMPIAFDSEFGSSTVGSNGFVRTSSFDDIYTRELLLYMVNQYNQPISNVVVSGWWGAYCCMVPSSLGVSNNLGLIATNVWVTYDPVYPLSNKMNLSFNYDYQHRFITEIMSDNIGYYNGNPVYVVTLAVGSWHQILSEFPSTTITNSTTTAPPNAESLPTNATTWSATAASITQSRITSDYSQLGIILSIVLILVLAAIMLARWKRTGSKGSA